MSKDNRRKINAKKIIKIVLIILYQILVIMALILTAIIVLQKVTNNNQSIGGYKIFRVITGSMEPEYEVGEVVISKEVNPKDIQIGDDIVYLGRNGEYAGKIIMHNVIGIDTDENGNLTFHAKGLHSSSVEDPQIKEEQIYGVVTYTSSFLTVLYDLATNIYSVFFIIIVLVLNVFISFRTPKKTKKRKVKRIANIHDEPYEDFHDDELEEEIEEEIEEIEEEEEVEEDENADIEEYEITEDEDYIEDLEKEGDSADIEKNTHEKMRQYYEKTINNTNNKPQERNKRNRKNK